MSQKRGIADTRNTDGTDAKGTGNAVKTDANGMSVLRVYVMSAPITIITILITIAIILISNNNTNNNKE